MSSLRSALVCQSVPFLVLLSLQETILKPSSAGLSLPYFVVLQGVLAGLISNRLRLPAWWTWIHFLFMPLLSLFIFFTDFAHVSSSWIWLGFFLLALLFNWNALGEKVPLYLTSPWTVRRILELIPLASSSKRFIDLGCGLGGPLAVLARARPSVQFVGVETAPLTYLAAKVRTLFIPNVSIQYQNIWEIDLAQYDWVYAFLSPAPMPKLWKKIKKEMRSDALFISNTFEVPHTTPKQTIHIQDLRKTRLLIYRSSSSKPASRLPDKDTNLRPNDRAARSPLC